MINICDSRQLKIADQLTIDREPILSVDLMERAAAACLQWILTEIPPGAAFAIFCGTGNNGGDGLALARLLHQRGKKVVVWVANNCGNKSPDFLLNLERIKKAGLPVHELDQALPDELKAGENELFIDALIGSGLNRPLEGQAADWVEKLNKSGAKIIAVDCPTGLYTDKSTPTGSTILHAAVTLTFQFPKESFLYPEYAGYCGEWFVLDIGLHEEGKKAIQSRRFLLEEADVALTLRNRPAFAHKGTFGHALLLAGSYGKTGAAILAAKAALRAGCGKISLRCPSSSVVPLQTAVPEAMVIPDEAMNHLESPIKPENWQAIGIGPGIGTAAETGNVLKRILQDCAGPFVIDADALNLLADNKTWLHFLPPGSILTPHLGEFERLCGRISDPYERSKVQLEFAAKFNCYVLLKGRFSALACPDGSLLFNPTGNPGMATGGSGDVLTGLITALLAQNYSPLQAAFCGMYLHGLAGDIAAGEIGMTGMIAGDIPDYLPAAFRVFGK